MFGGTGSRLPTSLVTLLVVFSSLSNGLKTRQEPQKDAKSLSEVLEGIPDLSTYYDLLKKNTNILFQIPNLDGVTLIAPSNEAFNKSHDLKLDDTAFVTSMLQYHIIRGVISVGSLEAGPSVFAPTLLTSKEHTNVTTGQNVIITRQHDETTVITSGLGSRSTVTEDGGADVPFSGGLIQIVDTLLVQPVSLEVTARDAYKDLTAFLGALYSTGLVSEFSTHAPGVTILAPRNAAFQKIASPISALSKEQLTSILRYHLVPDRILSSSSFFDPARNFTNGTLDTAYVVSNNEKKKVRTTRLGNNLFFNRAQLLQADVLVANGVLHVIDNVLNPDLEDEQQIPEQDARTQPAAFNQPATGASTSTGTRVPVPFTTWLPCTTSDCPVTSGTTTEGAGAAGGTATTMTTTTGGRDVSSRTSSGGGGGAGSGPRCTGVAMAMGMGIAVAGAVGMGFGAGVV